MKKLLILILSISVLFTANSCKTKEKAKCDAYTQN